MYQNIEAEKACLGACLVDKEALTYVIEELVEDDFYDAKHVNLYHHMIKMFKEGQEIDTVTVVSSMNLPDVAYLVQLIDSIPNRENIREYVSLVKQASVQRKQKDLLCKVESGDLNIEEAVVRLGDLTYEQVPEETFQAILENTLVSTLQGTEFTFSIHSFNKYLGGLDKGELLTIGGYTSQGKSDLAIQLAINQAKRGRGVLFLSTEMLPAEIGRRILGNLTSSRVMDLRKGMLSEEQRNLLEFSAREVGEEWNMNIKKIYSVDDVQRYVRKHNPEILFIDYIQNLSGDTDYKTATKNIKTIQSITLQNEIATVCVSQLNRNNQEIREPRLSDLRDTGRIEECSNIVVFIYWKERLEMSNPQRMGGEQPEEPVILIAKNRDGTIGRFPVHFYPEYAQIEDVVKVSTEEYQQTFEDK